MKLQVVIAPTGRLAFHKDLLFPDSNGYDWIAGVDLLYSKETDELAFEVYKLHCPSWRDRKLIAQQLDTTLTVKTDYSVNINAYLGAIGFFRLKTHTQTHNYEAYALDNYIVVKLNPDNPKSTIPAHFKPLTLERIRHPNEISLSTGGLLSLPIKPLAALFNPTDRDRLQKEPRMIVREAKIKTNIHYDQDSKTFTLTFGTDGQRSVKGDGTISLQTLLKQNGIEIPKRLFLPYTLSGKTLSFCLTDADPLMERKALREARKILGVLR
jgi:hypothetical protein